MMRILLVLFILAVVKAHEMETHLPEMVNDANDANNALPVYYHLEVPQSDLVPLSFFKQSITQVIREYNSSRGDQVLVTVNCPGGGYTYYGSVYSQLLRLNHRNIPWTAFIDEVGASGGYLAILGAEQIYGNELALVGSIGVVIEFHNNFQKLQKQGIVHEIFTAGDHKRNYSPGLNNTADNIAHLQEHLNYLHQQFIQTLELHRSDVMMAIAFQLADEYCQNVDDSTCKTDFDSLVKDLYVGHVRSVTQGDVWVGADAIKVGLMDGIMTYEGYLDAFDPNEYRLVESNQGNMDGLLQLLLG